MLARKRRQVVLVSVRIQQELDMTSTKIVRVLIACGIFCLASCTDFTSMARRLGDSWACPEKNGRFPVPGQCDVYVECIDGEAEEKLCPEGLMFNPEARFNYPCGYPIDVNCDGRPELQPARPTELCPHQYGYFKMGDKSNCGKFVNCVEGRGYIFDCPEGLAFNAQSYRCDWPDQVPDCDAESFLDFKCPEDYVPNEISYFRNDNDCQRYFICLNGKPRLQNCGTGRAFDEISRVCDYAENVAGCAPTQTLQDAITGSSIQQLSIR